MSTIHLRLDAYRDRNCAPTKRAADLLSRMTLREKIAQLLCVWNTRRHLLFDASGEASAAKVAEHFPDGLGQVGRPGDAAGGAQPGLSPQRLAETTNAIQRAVLAASRLAIPVWFHDECLHGFVATGATSFPQPIGLAATFNPDLVRRVYAIVAREARSCGVHQALCPVLDVARDPRWGRVEETFGEDPYLVGELGAAAVNGLQGASEFGDGRSVVATLKHFAAHSQPESGNNCAPPASASERLLREVFLAPFERVVRTARPRAIMASYNEIDGVPSHANRWLLRQVLRREWKFDGIVVSDYYGIRELHERPGLYGHHVAADAEQAALLAIKAGVNVELPEPDCFQTLERLVRSGALAEREINELVEPILRLKFELGLFEDPYVDAEQPERILSCDEHLDAAREAARQTITLLKNDGAALPLNLAGLRRIAVIGPNADRELLGGYSGRPRCVSTVLGGLRQRVGEQCEILSHEGCRITEGGSWWQDEVVLASPRENRARIAEAAAVAQQADVVVLVLGGNEQTSREAWMSNHLGDRTDLDLVGQQDELVAAIAATGKPIVAVLFNGRPLSVRILQQHAHAIVECWYLGQGAGEALAEVLCGDVNPSGKLPITIPRSVGHLPAFYNHRPSARRGYLFEETGPLWPFGFGLSYTQFELSAPALADEVISVDGSTTVSVVVSNVGNRRGVEVVQLYIRDLVSSVTRPVLELKGFQRVEVEPGCSQTVSFALAAEHLAFWNIDKQFVVEPGEFQILVGQHSASLQAATLTVV